MSTYFTNPNFIWIGGKSREWHDKMNFKLIATDYSKIRDFWKTFHPLDNDSQHKRILEVFTVLYILICPIIPYFVISVTILFNLLAVWFNSKIVCCVTILCSTVIVYYESQLKHYALYARMNICEKTWSIGKVSFLLRDIYAAHYKIPAIDGNYLGLFKDVVFLCKILRSDWRIVARDIMNLYENPCAFHAYAADTYLNSLFLDCDDSNCSEEGKIRRFMRNAREIVLTTS